MLDQSIKTEDSVIFSFGKTLESSIKVPYSFIVYGSYGRGTFTESSDIDLMVIFDAKDIDAVVNDRVVLSLPLEWMENPEKQTFIDEEDRAALKSGALDFLRIEGESNGIEVEIQLIPTHSVIKAVSQNGGHLKAGKKNTKGIYEVAPKKKSREQDYRGEVFSFERQQKMAATGNRVDSVECGHEIRNGVLTRSLTHNKLFAPKIIVDKLDFRGYLDEVILYEAIKSVLEAWDYLVKGENDEIVGIKTEGLDYRNYFDYLASMRVDKKDPLHFGEKEEEEFAERFSAQIKRILGGVKNGKHI